MFKKWKFAYQYLVDEQGRCLYSMYEYCPRSMFMLKLQTPN